MAVKITITPDFKKVRLRILNDWSDTLMFTIKLWLKKLIAGGISPAKGQGRFQKYSNSYSKSIRKGKYSSFDKRVRPVNLTLKGDLIKSLRISKKGKEQVDVEFTDRKALWHQKGNSKLPARKLLPDSEEAFSRTMNVELEKALEKVIKNAFK